MSNSPALSICIVTLNASPYLQNCLKSITEHAGSLKLEIVVVDNGSTDNAQEMLAQEYPEVVVITNQKNLGFSKANNQAIQAAKSEKYVLLLNPDTIVYESSLQNLFNFAEEHPQAGVIGPKVLNDDGSFQKHCKRGEGRPWETFAYFLKLSTLFPKVKLFSGYLQTHLDENLTHEVPAVSGCCMLIRRATLDTIGNLDEDLFAYQEDTEYCVRARKAGWKVFYTPAAQITHLGGKGGSRVQPYKAIYEWHRSYYIYYNKHLAKDYFFLFNWFYYVVMLFKFCFTIIVNLFRQEKYAGPNRNYLSTK
jgi:GT2 family glycosyltransferase